METVYKQLLDIAPGIYRLKGRKYQTVLSAKLQQGKIAIWFYCDPHGDPDIFEVEVYETGQHFQNNINRQFIGTVADEDYILHVFTILK